MSAVFQLRKKDEESGSLEAAALSALLEAWPGAVAMIENGNVLRANRAFAEEFGYSECVQVEGRKILEFVTGSASENAAGGAQECLGTRRDGVHIPLQAAFSYFCHGPRQLQIIRVWSVGRESESAQTPESLKLEAMGRLVGSVAHDFNNLLTGILLYSELVVAGLPAGNPLRAYAEEIRRAGNHSSGLTQQLLSMARPQSENLAAAWGEVVSGMWDLLSRLLGENIELAADLANGAQLVEMDPAHMRQILLNLLLNARDAMPEGGRITIGVAQVEGWVELVIADGGCGMDAETRARAFEDFFTTKQPGRGNGLGLATVDRIVKRANGAIEIASAPGEGTRVTVRLPRARGPHLRTDSVRSAGSSPKLQKPN